jgi:hypothetical protein
MGMSNRFADMNEVYVHTETTCKEQPAIRLRHMGRGPNDCRRQPRPQFAVAEGQTKAETQQCKKDQFWALEDQCEASPTQISNLYRHNEHGSRNSSAEHRTYGRQHRAQAHATRWVDGFKLDIPEFQGDLQPKEFMDRVAAVGEVLDFKEVPEGRRISLVATKLIDEDLSVDWASPPIYDIYPDEEEPLEEVNLLDSFAIFYDHSMYHVLDKSPKDKAFDLSVTPINYIDFIGVDAILSNSSNQVCDEIYMAEGSDKVVASYLKIFIAYGKDKARERHGKSTQQCEVRGLQYYRSLLMIKAVMFLMRCGLVVELSEGEWNELTGHPKDRGKDWPNSRTNSLQHRENDADQTEFKASLLLRSSAHRVPYVNFMFLVVKLPLFPCFSSIRVLRVFISLLY